MPGIQNGGVRCACDGEHRTVLSEGTVLGFRYNLTQIRGSELRRTQLAPDMPLPMGRPVANR